MSDDLLAKVIIKKLAKAKKSLAVAESVTAGGVANVLTTIPGASKVFLGGVIAYTDQVKIRELKISKAMLAKHTAVSEQVAIAMADGVRLLYKSDYAISTTGIAGPTGAYGQKVGVAWVGISSKKSSFAVALSFAGERESIRHAIITSALAALERTLKS